MTISIIEQIKSALPFETVLADAGVVLNHGKAPCPFHDDRSPSFTVKGDRWRCWAGCGSGDVIDFTARLHGLDTRGAIRLLADRAGIKTGPMTSAERREADEARRARERKARLIAAFRAWERKTAHEIAKVLRAYRHLRAAKKDYTEARRYRSLLIGWNTTTAYLPGEMTDRSSKFITWRMVYEYRKRTLRKARGPRLRP